MLDTDSINARVQRWDASHSQEGTPVQQNGWLLFPDGATRECHPLGVWQEPPQDAYQRATRVALYHSIVAQRAVDQFHQRRDYFQQACKAARRDAVLPPAPVEQIEAELNQLAHAARVAQQRWNQAKEAADKLMPTERRADREVRQHLQQLNDDALSRLKQIEI